jgi:cytochrome oxidase Cu insertion factor (SCO1/SenC/PrrC family)
VRPLRKLAGIALSLGLAALCGCGSAATAGSQQTASQAAAEANPNLDLGSSMGNKPAPDIRLDNQFGQPMSLSQFRGKVVILAFADSECTTVCPLTTESMVLAKELLGRAGTQVQLLGVDANPVATSVSDVMAYSKVHGMVNQWDFLTGPLAALKQTWKSYDIAAQVQQGLIDHTPALYVIDTSGRLRKVYLTAMAYDSVGQSAQVLATEASSLLPGHPKLKSNQSLAAIPSQGPSVTVGLPSASGSGTVTLGPGKPRLVLFFASWLSETSSLRAELLSLNQYRGLPSLVGVDETVTEPSAGAVRPYLSGLRYPVGLDETGRVADGYQAQGQPWFVLVNAKGAITWSHDSWLSLSALEAAAHDHL